MTKDWAGVLFSYRGAYPEPLPERFYIAPGEVRRRYCVSLEDIHQSGFIGPIDPPVAQEGQIIKWDTQNLVFVIENPPSASDIYNVNLQKIKEEAGQLLAAAPEEIPYVSAFPYVNAENLNSINQYKAQLNEIINKEYFEPELPEIPALNLILNSEELNLLAEYETTVKDNISKWKEIYELFGEDESLRYPVASGVFVIPPDWVRSPISRDEALAL